MELRDLTVARFNYSGTILIPIMKVSCSGTIKRVRVAGRLQEDGNRHNIMKIQIWRENITDHVIYHRINNIALPSECEMDMLTPTWMSRGIVNDVPVVYECTLKQNIPVTAVKIGDILGIELSPDHATNFEFYSVTGHKLVTNFIFEYNLSSTIDLNSRIGNETAAQPLIIIEVVDPGV